MTELFHSDTATIAEVSEILEDVISRHPSAKERIRDASIILYLEFEMAIAKIQDEKEKNLTAAHISIVKLYKKKDGRTISE